MGLLRLLKYSMVVALIAILSTLTLSETADITSFTLIPCKNNGTQSLLNNSICECKSPWTGDHCTDYACVHGLPVGENFDENSIYFNKRCLCDTGYTGELCDTLIINPCGSHGTFSENVCVCNANYTGPKCEFVEYCLNGQLSNGRCHCHYGWTSDFCDTIVCHQGIADEKGSNCTCKFGYRGRFCDFCADPESSPYPECTKPITDTFNRSKVIIAGGAILVVICISALVFIVILRIMRLKSGRSRYSSTSDDFDKRMQLMNRANDQLPS